MLKMNVGRGWGFVGSLFGLILALSGLTGCQTAIQPDDYAQVPGMEHVAVPPPGDPNGAFEPGTDPVESKIDVGDVLQISFTDIPTPLQPLEQKVQDDGTIKLHYSEVFQAAGLTRSQLEQEVHKRYVPKYFTRLTVMIVHAGATRYYFIGGEVKGPGQKPYIGRLTVTQAIQAAGDFTEFAKKTKVKLIRPNGRIEYVNAKKALQDPKLDRWVYPNDKIHVPRSIF